jgi:membrane fusion protein (multidrug efflux system)
VTTGLRREGKVEITAGLAPGDLVVTAGQLKVRDGSAVATGGARPGGAPAGIAGDKAPAAVPARTGG